jgi:hypothetical protein
MWEVMTPPPDRHAERFERCFERNYRDIARACARRAATPEDAATQVFATAWIPATALRQTHAPGRDASRSCLETMRECEDQQRSYSTNPGLGGSDGGPTAALVPRVRSAGAGSTGRVQPEGC